MARFRSLSDVIAKQIKDTVKPMSVPLGTPTSVLTGQSQPVVSIDDPQPGVLRWGYSTWGIEPVTGLSTPQG